MRGKDLLELGEGELEEDLEAGADADLVQDGACKVNVEVVGQREEEEPEPREKEGRSQLDRTLTF